MAVYRQKHDGAMPLATGGWKGVFFCCFGKKSDTTTDTIKGNGTNHYGSTNKDEVDGEKKGSAYAYEEHESSSDSEDEDLKRFNQARNSRRSNSVRSAGIDKGVIATEHEEVKQYDNQAYQLDTPSNIGSTEEHLFDVSDLTHDPDAQLISKCGQLEVTFNYQQENCKMHITVNHAKDIPSKDRGGANSTQIRLLLLPTKKQRHKTKIKTGEHPVFEETFTFKVPPDAVGEMGIRMRLYGCERMRRERMIGESVVGFASLNLEQATTHLLTLAERRVAQN